MSMATVQLYKNRFTYPDYGSITAVGNAVACTPVGTGLKTGSIKMAGTMASFMNCNYLALTRSGKTIYAFIEDVAFSTADSFLVTYRVDPWRTYRGNITLGTQFIERSNTVTNKVDELLGATQSYPDYIETVHNIGNSSQRILVVQVKVGDGEFFSNAPVQPVPYRFYFYPYNIHDWAADPNLNMFISAITGTSKPSNIVTLYSIPYANIAHLETSPLIVLPSGASISGFKVLQENRTMMGKLYNETKINIGTDIDKLLRVGHEIQVVVPDAGILTITDSMLKDGDLYLRQDVDMFSGASNYMIVGSTKYFSQSIRGSSTSTIPIVSDPMDTYLSQNQNALATSLIGDVASVAGGIVVAGATGGLGMAAGAGIALNGINGIVARSGSIADKRGTGSNPAAFLGTALANSFNQTFWVIVTKNPVDNASAVNGNFGYPMNKMMALTFPSSGYIKTQGCAVTSDGTVPRWAIEEVNTLFNNGIAVH